MRAATRESVKRALEIKVEGFHRVLMFGPPGSGESETPHRTARFPASTRSDSHDLTKGG
jgi:predicted ATPase with chaperone activity